MTITLKNFDDLQKCRSMVSYMIIYISRARSKGLGLDSCSAGHVCKALGKLGIHTASVHPSVMGTWCTIQGWINSARCALVAEPLRGRERVG